MNESEIIVSFVVWLALYVPIAMFYFTFVRWHVEDLAKDSSDAENGERMSAQEHTDRIIQKHGEAGDNLREFTSGLFSCKKPSITFWSFCCPGIRWADTMDKLGIFRFWLGFWIMTALYCISFFPNATILCQLTVVAFMTYHRQSVREAFDFEDQGGVTWITDCFTYMCCMCCAVAQEARHTRLACIMEHHAIHQWPKSAREKAQAQ